MTGAWPGALSRNATRIVALACGLALLAGAAAGPATITATELGDRISSSRAGQSYFESAMLAQDAIIARIDQQTRESKRALRAARKGIKRSGRALRLARETVQKRAARLAYLESLYAGVPPEGIPAGYPDRLSSVRREVAKAEARKQQLGVQNRTWLRAQVARESRLGVLKRQRRAAVTRRESAEGGLGGHIVRLTSLAQQRAEIQSAVNLSATGAGFSWPAIGRIAQTYGCTGFYLNPSRGSCRHFHDGLDIVAGHGSRVKAAADGVVAYAGWNPWDKGGRAWIMVVSHPGGWVSRYGHLLPGALADVGRFVRAGEAIGRMGNTGNSLGTHLHFELLRGGTTVNPWAYLPAGMVQLKVADKRSGKHSARSKGQASRKRSAKGGSARGLGLSDTGNAIEYADPFVVAPAVTLTTALEYADPFAVAPAVTLTTAGTTPSRLPKRLKASWDVVETGVPLPSRGTSPSPS